MSRLEGPSHNKKEEKRSCGDIYAALNKYKGHIECIDLIIKRAEIPFNNLKNVFMK